MGVSSTALEMSLGFPKRVETEGGDCAGFLGVIVVGSNRAQLEKLRLGVSTGEMIAQH